MEGDNNEDEDYCSLYRQAVSWRPRPLPSGVYRALVINVMQKLGYDKSIKTGKRKKCAENIKQPTLLYSFLWYFELQLDARRYSCLYLCFTVVTPLYSHHSLVSEQLIKAYLSYYRPLLGYV